MPKTQIFISHTAKEKELAILLKEHLTKDFLGALDIFVSSDGKTILAGSDWLKELNKSLSKSKVEIILCSKESVGRPWVNFEAGAGWIRGIPVIPVCHSGMYPNNLPIPLILLQAVEASKPEGLRVLYETIAQYSEMQAPAADFNAIADAVKSLEATYKRAEQTLDRIENSRILCAASEQFTELGFEKDIEVLEKAFPKRVTVESNLTSKRFRELLTTQQFDILHLVLAVDRDNADLIFSPIDHANNEPLGGRVDKITAAGFTDLLIENQARLVVMATCWALPLAVESARVTNAIGTHIQITADEVAEWGECFYEMLANGTSLYKSFDHTKLNFNVPLQLICKKDVAFAPVK